MFVYKEAMKTIHDTRRENLAFAIRHYFKNARQMALDIGVSPNSVSRVFAENPKNRRNVGDDMARAVEKAAELPEGWMDVAHSDGDAAISAGVADIEADYLASEMSGISDDGLERAIKAISKRLPAKDAVRFAKLLLDRADEQL